ncbi:hypothetical protein PHSY_005703 [Pseudozyma hubeiensis SY62]|uniref:NUDE domain-containing protein n=1 Tax=Pseudozyma hubeiensis (strain SY62) TaxID=1305764 RepID=R9P9T1_PSEHS|nr:hypothetical protein PHSY_005703 [Pseudozyma hubeiensis SY62]GAC98114.1 hypothetical protein PHSY_005703 [Pseudozyma hubeiensis SY62]
MRAAFTLQARIARHFHSSDSPSRAPQWSHRQKVFTGKRRLVLRERLSAALPVDSAPYRKRSECFWGERRGIQPHFESKCRFDSPEKEIKHWKSKVADMQDALRETESSLQDFMESSKELEQEMEKELSASNKTISDLKRRNEQLTGDLEDWKSKYSRALSEHNSTLTNLQKELGQFKEAVDVYKAKLRDTELTNDELENAERMVASSLADMEGKYNKTIEKTALLEEELIEKTRLDEENQRLKDELREMTEEMTILRDMVTRSRAVSRADTMASSTYDDSVVPRSDQSFDSSPSKPSVAARVAERPSSRQAIGSPSINRVPISRRLGAMGHNRRLSRDVRAAEAPSLAAVQDDSPAAPTSAAPTRTSTLSRRDTLAGTPSHHGHSSSHGLASSPSARAQVRASVRAAVRLGGSAIPSTPRSGIPSVSGSGGAAGSKRMMAEMISKMKALETRINSAKDLSRVVGPGDESAIPRPSSRMATIGSPSANGHNSFHIPTSTPRAPRASMDGNRTIGSSIPVPSRVRRPSSRMSERVHGPRSSQHPPTRSSLRRSPRQRGQTKKQHDRIEHDTLRILRFARQGEIRFYAAEIHNAFYGSCTQGHAEQHVACRHVHEQEDAVVDQVGIVAQERIEREG